MNYQFSYLIGDLTLLIIWFVLFFLRKDTKKEMFAISLIFGFAGLVVDPIYSSDWWHPLTITNTLPGIESFIFGFVVSGIASVIYEEIFRKKIKVKKVNKKEDKERNFHLLLIGLLSVVLFFGSYFILRLNSFYASFPAFLVPLTIILIKRKDLVVDSILSGIILMIFSFLFYIVPEIIFPGWISFTWNFKMVSGLTILKVPIEDLIWFFLAGMLIGPLYEYWQEGKIRKYG